MQTVSRNCWRPVKWSCSSLSQSNPMTPSYIPPVAITYFFRRVKPIDVMTPYVIDLPLRQKATFEAMAVSSAFGVRAYKAILAPDHLASHTSSLREKSETKNSVTGSPTKSLISDRTLIMQKDSRNLTSHNTKQVVARGNESSEDLKKERAAAKRIVLAYWDPELFNSKFLWPITCFFGASFGALHLISWHTVFSTPLKQWLWRPSHLLVCLSVEQRIRRFKHSHDGQSDYRVAHDRIV